MRPAPELMDHYAVPSDAEKISDWLLKNADGCREAVIVVEQLVYGGLISSRNMKTSEEEAKEEKRIFSDAVASFENSVREFSNLSNKMTNLEHDVRDIKTNLEHDVREIRNDIKDLKK